MLINRRTRAANSLRVLCLNE